MTWVITCVFRVRFCRPSKMFSLGLFRVRFYVARHFVRGRSVIATYYVWINLATCLHTFWPRVSDSGRRLSAIYWFMVWYSPHLFSSSLVTFWATYSVSRSTRNWSNVAKTLHDFSCSIILQYADIVSSTKRKDMLKLFAFGRQQSCLPKARNHLPHNLRDI
jgi:hypothetical protein